MNRVFLIAGVCTALLGSFGLAELKSKYVSQESQLIKDKLQPVNLESVVLSPKKAATPKETVVEYPSAAVSSVSLAPRQATVITPISRPASVMNMAQGIQEYKRPVSVVTAKPLGYAPIALSQQSQMADAAKDEMLIESKPLEIAGSNHILKQRFNTNAANSLVLGEKEKNKALNQDVIEGTVARKGERIEKVLSRVSDADSVAEYTEAVKKIHKNASLKAGQPYKIIVDKASGRIKRFEYDVNDSRRMVVEGIYEPRGKFESVYYDVQLAVVRGTVKTTLFQAMEEAKEKPQLLWSMQDIFKSDINFIRDIQYGDSFAVLVEKKFMNNKFRGYGRIVAASFVNKGKNHEAYVFVNEYGKECYYTGNGDNLNRAFLQMPLAYTRISSGYTGNRLHPVLKVRRAHYGIDYAAPSGTPVKAIGAGTISFRGVAGGYGKQVIIRHDRQLESMYGHLRGYAKNIRVGLRVDQGTVIGYVGQTGLASGPHLDFRLRQNGKFINPSDLVNPRNVALANERKTAFRNNVRLAQAFMEGKRPLSSYTAGMFLQKKDIARLTLRGNRSNSL